MRAWLYVVLTVLTLSCDEDFESLTIQDDASVTSLNGTWWVVAKERSVGEVASYFSALFLIHGISSKSSSQAGNCFHKRVLRFERLSQGKGSRSVGLAMSSWMHQNAVDSGFFS